ncbi:S-layer homology domain-containing protein [Paenibacillus alginolyticus]|uniref:S-layer homology domain-containing protein n=1 Tax=Paenibacillus alginolyticus TaxID=59839 RepID=UPI00040731B6|nr:S-layer homology domain-containing protein [Paenibacillus alginolyticus]MCY9670156.1 S-layer homology domain-containing protein [Paenibacillus alginolyticus]
MKSTKLTMIATAAMAFSLFASASLSLPASAAAKTSADFSDLAGSDAALKAKIDAMIAAGVFEGVSDSTFGITQNMTRAQFAKVATLIYNITVDPTVKVSSFSDVNANDTANGWAIPYIEAAKKAGLIDGVTDTTFLPGDSVTTAQLDTVLLKGLGKKISMTGSPWYADAVKQATELGIHPASKSGDQPANRADLVISSYTAQQVFGNQTRISITNTQASSSDNKKVQVTFNKKVDASKATLTLKNGSTIVPTTTEWASDGQSATLTANLALAAGDYTVTLGGLDASTIQTTTGSFSVIAPSTGNVSINGTYTLASVLDSGLTDAATGSNGLVSKATAEDPTLSKLAKEIEIKVTSASGDPIAIPGVVQSVHSSDPSIAKVGLTSDHHAYVLGNKPGTADISVIVQIGNGDAKQLHVTVTVKSDAITAKEIKAGQTTIEKTVTGSVYTFNAYTEMDLSITDNYGIKYKSADISGYNFALGTLFITNDIKGNPAVGAVGTVEIDAAGNVNVTGNVTSFEITAVTPTGEKATSFVTLNH